MEIKKIENYNNEPIGQDSYYEIWLFNKAGDEVQLDMERYFEYNPFDLNDIVELYLKLKGYEHVYFIKKISEEIVDLTVIPEIAIKLDTKKYNL